MARKVSGKRAYRDSRIDVVVEDNQSDRHIPTSFKFAGGLEELAAYIKRPFTVLITSTTNLWRLRIHKEETKETK